MNEEWRAVVGFDGYEVSSLGRVRSLDRVREYTRVDQYSGKELTVKRRHNGRILRPGKASNGYLTVALGRGRSVYVNILVLNAFVGPRPKGCECLHWDDDRENNQISNLRWGTRSQNLHDAVRNGCKPIGSRVWNAKLDEASVSIIKKQEGLVSSDVIAGAHGVSGATIRQVFRGRTWKHVQ